MNTDNVQCCEYGWEGVVGTPECATYESDIEPMQRDPIVEAVREIFLSRSTEGILKYGTTLARNDLLFLEWLTHLQEELMDAVVYIERIKKELGDS
jgi:hypothetical protein